MIFFNIVASLSLEGPTAIFLIASLYWYMKKTYTRFAMFYW